MSERREAAESEMSGMLSTPWNWKPMVRPTTDMVLLGVGSGACGGGEADMVVGGRKTEVVELWGQRGGCRRLRCDEVGLFTLPRRLSTKAVAVGSVVVAVVQLSSE